MLSTWATVPQRPPALQDTAAAQHAWAAASGSNTAPSHHMDTQFTGARHNLIGPQDLGQNARRIWNGESGEVAKMLHCSDGMKADARHSRSPGRGQHVLRCNCYLPSVGPQHRICWFIEDIIHRVLRHAHMHVLLHGDFSFVEHVGLDRMHHKHHLHEWSHHDAGTTKVWQRMFGDLHDCFRLNHAHVRSFT